MESKLFSYKAEGIALEPVNDLLNISAVFDRKALVNKIKDLFKDDNFKVDERSLDYKIREGQLYIEGLLVKHEETRSIGFMLGK